MRIYFLRAHGVMRFKHPQENAMDFSRHGIEPGSPESCLRTIVRTRNQGIDRLYAAIEQASLEDIALLTIAVNCAARQSQEAKTP
jgi:hypothetical protein